MAAEVGEQREYVAGRTKGECDGERWLASSPAAGRGLGLALAVLLSGTFMAGLDVTIVNVAGPTIAHHLALSGASLQLVVSAYIVVYAALLITGARLGDDHGHKRLFLGGAAGFTAASLLCGLAPSGGVLVGARAIQGAFAAAMAPQVVTIIQLRLGGPARARALALFAATLAVGGTAGLVLGGLLVSADVLGSSWRAVFLVNVPVGLVLVMLGRRVIPMTPTSGTRRLDLLGATLLAVAAVLVMLPLVYGHETGWPAWAWACLGASVLAGTLLAFHLRRSARRGEQPLVDLSLMREAAFAGGLITLCLQMVAYGGLLFAISLHLQRGLAYSPLVSGLTFVPYGLGFALGSVSAPRLFAASARQAAVAGLVTMAAAYVALALVARDRVWHEGAVLVLLAVAGAGFGAGYGATLSRTLEAVLPARARDASGMFTTVNQLSLALGVATIGSRFLTQAGPMLTPAASAHALAATLTICAVLGSLAALTAALCSGSEGSDRAPSA